MTSKVIQGFFIGCGPRPPSRVAQPTAMPRPPGPPAPAFAGRPTMAQRHGAGEAFSVDPRQLGLVSGGGRALPDGVRSKMEAVLGADFSNVRVHVGPQAERIGAIAFTLGSDIYFAPGRFQPETVQGQQLLGHELTHVVQQRQGRVRNPSGSGVAVVQDRALEAEADRLGQQAASTRSQPSNLQLRSSDLRMRSPFGENRKVVQRAFIGDQGRHHMHIDIQQPHYKDGNNVGGRINIGPDNAYRQASLEEVIDHLSNRLGESGAQDCYDWCLDQARALARGEAGRDRRRARQGARRRGENYALI